MTQDGDGVLWILASESVVRFDAFDFDAIPLNALDVDVPLRVLRGDDESIVVVGRHGFWTLQDGRFFYRSRSEIAQSASRMSDASTELDRLLFTHEGGEYVAWELPAGVSYRDVTATVGDRQSGLWAGTDGKGLWRYEPDSSVAVELGERFRGVEVTALFEDADGRLWVGTSEGLFIVAEGSSGVGSRLLRLGVGDGLSSDIIEAIAQDENGDIWIGTRAGLGRITYIAEHDLTISSVLTNVAVKALLVDREGNLWIGTRDQGLKSRRRIIFSAIDLETGDSTTQDVDVVFQDRSGRIWAGTGFGELYLWEGGRFRQFLPEPDPFDREMFTMAEDARGRLLFGTEHRGVWILESGRLAPYETRSGTIDGTIVTLFCDRFERLWVGRYGEELGYYDEGRYTQFLDREDYPGKMVFNSLEDSHGNLWIGGSHGLFYLPLGSTDTTETMRLFTESFVQAIHEDETGTIWVGTNDDGLFRLHPGTFEATAITADDGLGTDGIIGILEDDSGFFWLTTERGILRIHRDTLQAFPGNRRERLTVTAFAASDGGRAFPIQEIKTSSGELLYATARGLVVADPEEVVLNSVPPGVVLFPESENGRDRRLPAGDSLLFETKSDALVEIHVRAVTFRGTDALTYKYMLEGRDDDWTYAYTAGELTVEYSDLDPGDYTFRATAANNYGVWNEEGSSLQVVVRPALVHSMLFRFLLLAAALLPVGVVAEAYRRRRHKQCNKYRKTRLHEDTAERYQQAVTRILEKDKAFRDSTLSLKSLAKRLDIPPHHLSQAINQRLGKNFFQLINEYRIEEAKRILIQDNAKDQKIVVIAFDVGFNTLNSFNRTFKRHVGKTPTEFRDENGNRSAD